MTSQLPDLLTRKDIAARTHCSLRKVDHLLHSPLGPRVTRIGASVLVRADHFLEWLDRQALPRSSGQSHEEEMAA